MGDSSSSILMAFATGITQPSPARLGSPSCHPVGPHILLRPGGHKIASSSYPKGVVDGGSIILLYSIAT